MSSKHSTENKRRILYVVLISIPTILIFIVAFLYLSQPKIAYVRGLELVYGYNGMREAHAEFKSQSLSWQANIDTLQMQYQKSLAAFQQNYNSYSSKEKETQQAMLDRMEYDMKNYAAAVQEQAENREKKLTEGVLNQINSFVQSYAKEKGYDLVLGADGNGSIMYGNEKFDITDEVLKVLNENHKIIITDSLVNK